MKFDFPPRVTLRDTAIRPGFDVLLAVIGARQAASPTARLVAAGRTVGQATDCTKLRTGLLANGQVTATTYNGISARFADLAMPAAPERDNEGTAGAEMNGPFTTAFQPMVKHVDLEGPLNAERPVGDGPEVE
jgi:hypothetical protein